MVMNIYQIQIITMIDGHAYPSFEPIENGSWIFSTRDAAQQYLNEYLKDNSIIGLSLEVPIIDEDSMEVGTQFINYSNEDTYKIVELPLLDLVVKKKFPF